MKSSNTSNPTTGSGWNGWNARRSYNLLRLSLGHPMNHSLIQADAKDEEMEIDEDLADTFSDLSHSTVMEHGSSHVGNLKEEVVGWSSNGDSEAEDTSVTQSNVHSEGTDNDTPNIESPTFELLENARPGVPSPTNSPPPKGKDENMENKNVFQSGLYPLAENEGVVDSELKVMPADEKAGVPAYLQSSKSLPSPSPRDRLAASLQKGLQILDNHQKSSLATIRRCNLMPTSSLMYMGF
jgi:hypothetical protein